MKKLFWGFIVMSFFSCEKRNDEGGSGIKDKNEFTNIKFKNAALLFREGNDGELDVVFYDFASKNTFTYMRKKEGPADSNYVDINFCGSELGRWTKGKGIVL